MTIEQRSLFYKGKELWLAYVNLNGYASSPDADGIRSLAKELNVTQAYLRQCISAFLDA